MKYFRGTSLAVAACFLLLTPLAWAEKSPDLIPLEKTSNLTRATVSPGLEEEIRRMSELERLRVEKGIHQGYEFANLYFEGVATHFEIDDSAAWARIAPLVVVSDEEWQEMSRLSGKVKIGGVELDRAIFLVCPQIILSAIESHTGQLTLTYHATIMGALSFADRRINHKFYPVSTKPPYKLTLYLNEHRRVTKFVAQNDEGADVYLRWAKIFEERAAKPDRLMVVGVSNVEAQALAKHYQVLEQQIMQQAAQVCR